MSCMDVICENCVSLDFMDEYNEPRLTLNSENFKSHGIEFNNDHTLLNWLWQ